MSTPPEILEIGKLLLTQDNRCTADPQFCVQENVTVTGVDPEYSDGITVWILDGEEVEPDTEGAEEFGVLSHWETKMTAFTEEGCKEYIRQNGHNHRGELRIYVESFRRCPEMIAIRKFLMELAQP